MSALDKLTELASTLENEAVKDWKRQGGKVVGFFCMYVPEEILYAADILPYRLRAPGCTETTSADVYMSHLNCSFARSCLEYAFEGQYDFLDGMVATNSCDDIRRMYDNLRTVAPGKYAFMDFIDVPKKVDDDAVAWYRDGLVQFKEHVQKAFGVEITDRKLEEAITVYNETRELLRQFSDLRKRENPPISGAETMNVMLAATMTPKREFNALVRQLLEELKDREEISGYRARLMIAGGGGCDDPEYYHIMEDLGGLIVADADCFGSRYFWRSVDIGDDLMLSLARAYMDRPTCARMANRIGERIDFLKEIVASHKVDGVIYQIIRYCQLWGGQVLAVRGELKKADIPFVNLDREYALSGVGQLKTRVQAFIERIER